MIIQAGQTEKIAPSKKQTIAAGKSKIALVEWSEKDDTILTALKDGIRNLFSRSTILPFSPKQSHWKGNFH
jgi:hypothetical protein